MKKNTLIVQSLLLLPLLTAAPLLGMEYKEKPISPRKSKSQKRQAKQNQNNTIKKEPISYENLNRQLMSELTSSTIFQSQRAQNSSDSTPTNEYHPIVTETVKTVVDYSSFPFITELIEELNADPYVAPTNTLIQSEHESINVTLPECMQSIIVNQNLLQSVMLPTEEKGLTFLEKVSYYTSTKSQVVQSIIKQLENKTFDASNLTSFNIFTEAITTAANNNDVNSLATIADLCSKNYPQTIRIFDDVVAQQASGFLTTHYMTELTRANETMKSRRQEHLKEWTVETAACVTAMTDIITKYNQSVKNISDNYHSSIEQEETRIKTLRTQVSTFGLLNKPIRNNIDTLLAHNKLELPTNKFDYTMQASESKLNSLAKIAKDMPQIITFDPSKLAKCLELDQKK